MTEKLTKIVDGVEVLTLAGELDAARKEMAVKIERAYRDVAKGWMAVALSRYDFCSYESIEEDAITETEGIILAAPDPALDALLARYLDDPRGNDGEPAIYAVDLARYALKRADDMMADKIGVKRRNYDDLG